MATRLKERIGDKEVIYPWHDPEFWGAPGLGCARCHEQRPLVYGLPFGGALCEHCLLRIFTSFDFERLVKWLGRQRDLFLRSEERHRAYEAWRRGDDRLAIAYKEKYGVWLIS